jgi:hypothetical protein
VVNANVLLLCELSLDVRKKVFIGRNPGADERGAGTIGKWTIGGHNRKTLHSR